VSDHQRGHANGDGAGSTQTQSWWPFGLAMAFLAAVFAVAAAGYFHRHPLPLWSEASLYCCLILLLSLAVIPAVPASRALAARWINRRGRFLILLAVWITPYLIYAAGCDDFRWAGLFRLLCLCTPPLLIYCAWPVRDLSALAWQDAIAWIWLMLAIVLRQWKGIWNVPVSLDFMARLFVIGVAAWCWVFIRPVPGLGYSFRVSVRTLRAVAINFGAFALIALPASALLHFAGWNPKWPGVQAFCLNYVEILVFVAWLEELFFRGFLQSLLSKSLKSPVAGQVLASLSFGLSHVLIGPAPNWRYVMLASLAGWFYGSVFRQSGNLAGPSLTHALVDTVWRTWFHAPPGV
jgi:uncharacterized protein